MKKDERKLLEKINKIDSVKKNFDPSIFKIETKEEPKKKKFNLGFLVPIFASIVIVLLVQSINIKGTNNSEPVPPSLEGESPSSPSNPIMPDVPGSESPTAPEDPNNALIEYFMLYEDMDASVSISLKDLVNNELKEIAQNILDNKYLDSPNLKSQHGLFVEILQDEITKGNFKLSDIVLGEDLEEDIYYQASASSKPEIGNLNKEYITKYILEYFDSKLNN